MRTTAVIYLWAPNEAIADATFDEQAKACEGYAFRFCWEIVETIRDVGGSNTTLDGRTGLDRVLALLKAKQAVVVLTANVSMIGGNAEVFDAVSEEVEKRGFVQVVRSD